VLAADLVARGLDVHIITRRSDRGLARREVIDGVPVERIPPDGPRRFARWLMVLSSLYALVRMRRRYDIIFVSGFKSLGIAAVLVSRLFGKVCVLKADSNGEMSGAFFASGLKAVRLRPSAPVVRAFLAARNAVLRRADCFIAITSSIAEEFRRSGIDPTAIHVVTNGVDTARFRPARNGERVELRRRLRLPVDQTIVTYAGRLVTYKGLPLLMTVAERLHREHDNVMVLLIGSGGLDINNCEGDLTRYVAARGLGSVVRFAGEVPNVHEFLQASDIFVLPTEDDAFPLALVEAMACGLPIVATRVGGIVDIVTHGEDGLLVAPGEVDELYAALDGLIGDRSRAASLGCHATATVQARFAREIVAAKYIELFQRAAGWESADLVCA